MVGKSVIVAFVEVRRGRDGRTGVESCGLQNSAWSIVASLCGVTLCKSVNHQDAADVDLRKS